jgi:hypothetical protein
MQPVTAAMEMAAMESGKPTIQNAQ